MRKAEKFGIDENGLNHESLAEDFVRDLGEINAKYGDDAQLVFEQRALWLKRRTLEEAKAIQTPGRGGRPKSKPVDGERLRQLRGDISQDALAEACGVSLDTIQRGECDERWSKDSFKFVACGLTGILKRKIRPKDLEKL